MKELSAILQQVCASSDRRAFQEIEAPELVHREISPAGTRELYVYKDQSGGFYLRHCYQHFRGWIEKDSEFKISADTVQEALEWFAARR